MLFRHECCYVVGQLGASLESADCEAKCLCVGILKRVLTDDTEDEVTRHEAAEGIGAVVGHGPSVDGMDTWTHASGYMDAWMRGNGGAGDTIRGAWAQGVAGVSSRVHGIHTYTDDEVLLARSSGGIAAVVGPWQPSSANRPERRVHEHLCTSEGGIDAYHRGCGGMG